MSTTPRVARRGPHPVRLRQLTVRRVTQLSPSMRRITLGGDDLVDFRSDAPDDHVKLFFPAEGAPLPEPGEDGRLFAPGSVRPPNRDYTPRRFDPAARELDIDFVLHGHGPAATWAATATPGDVLLVGGPRGSLIVADDFDWYLLVGDDSALPAIARRIEEAPAGQRIVAFVEVSGPEDEQAIESAADVQLTWLHRGDASAGTTELLEKAVRGADFPGGEYFAFVAGESHTVAAIRAHLLTERGANRDWMQAKGYWKLGEADAGR